MTTKLTRGDCRQISEILERRAREVSEFRRTYTNNSDHHGSVELALTREVDRLRRLAERVEPPEPDAED